MKIKQGRGPWLLWGLMAVLLGLLSVPAAGAQLPLVAVVATGGTIAEKCGSPTGGTQPALNGQELIKAVPGLGKKARLKVVNFANIDSSQMSPEIWSRLSRAVDQELARPEVTAAVVMHGTDTMAEAAFFLDLTLVSPKPVVFTGAMRDASQVSPDGPANLLDAVTLAVSSQAPKWGVTVCLNQYINAARFVRKTQTTNPQTFDSGQRGYLGYIQGGKVYSYRGELARLGLPLPKQLPRVALLTTYAGDKGLFVRHAADQGFQGMVVQGLGAGNVNFQVFTAIKYALQRGLVVAVTTRVPHGAVYPIYGDKGGGLSLEKAGAILTGGLKGPKARLLLMLALAQTKDRDRLARYFRVLSGE